jgi:hypothetical protein
LKAGVELIWHGVACRIHEALGDKIVLARYDRDELRVVDANALNIALSLAQVELRSGGANGCAEQVLPFGGTMSGHSKAVTDRLLQLSDWLRELDGIGLQKINPKNSAHQKALHHLLEKSEGKLVECSIWTLYRVQQKVNEARGDLHALLPKYHLRGRSMSEVIEPETGEITRVCKPRVDPVVANCLIDAISAQQDNANSKLRIKDVAKDLRHRLGVQNLHLPMREQLVMPSSVTIARWLKRTIPAHELSKRRIGPGATKKAYRSNRARVAAERILEFVQFDDVDARVFLVDEDTGLPWGTAKFTFGIDEKSQCLMGVTAGPEPRDMDSAISTVIHAMRRKNMAEPMLQGCASEWKQCGQFGLAILDNASYNAASSFKLAMMDLGVDFAFAKPKEPTNKSKIEGFNRTFKHLFAADLPGACVRKNDRDNLNPALRKAKLTLDEFLKESMRWIVDEYSHTRGEDGRSPMERWQEQVEGLDLRPPLMARPEFAEFILPATLKFRDSGGLERNNLRYQSDRLDELRRELGNKSPVQIRVNPQNLERVFVADLQCREWFSVPCVEDPAYVRGLTERQHQLTRKFAAEAKKQMRLTTEQLKWTRDDLRLQALKGQTSKQLSVRGTAFLVKHAFRSLPALDRTALAEAALHASRQKLLEAHESNPKAEKPKTKPTRMKLLESAFADFDARGDFDGQQR